MLAGGAIGYKTKFQPVIAHSSTELEFIAPCDTAKMILFFRSLLEELGVKQQVATIMYEDNTGELLMANAQQPIKRTRHIEIKHFALLDWVEQDLLTLHIISTHNNAADAMTKPLSKQLFYCHMDTYMGYEAGICSVLCQITWSNQKGFMPQSANIAHPAEHEGGIGRKKLKTLPVLP